MKHLLHGVPLGLRMAVYAVLAFSLLGFGLGVCVTLPYFAARLLYKHGKRWSIAAAAWLKVYGPLLPRQAARWLFVAFMLPATLAMWTLALPYAALDWQSRRDHLRDFRTSYGSVASWQRLGRYLVTFPSR